MARTILFLNDSVEIGGGEINLLAFLAGLNRSLWRPIVTCPGDGPLANKLRESDVIVRKVKFPDWRKLKDVPCRVKALMQLSRIVKEENVCLIHSNSPPWFPLGYWLGRFNQIPTVVSVQGPLKLERVRQFCLSRASLVISISDTLKDLLIAAGVSADRIQVVHNCVDTEYFSPNQQVENVRTILGIHQNDFVLGCVANLAPYKGQDVLVEAFSLVVKNKPDAHCILVGRNDEPFGLKVRDAVNRLGLSERVHFVSYEDDIRPFLASMDLFVLASRSEGFGIVLLEAMAMAKPVIATRVGGIPEAVHDQVTGLLVPSQDSRALASNILKLAEDPQRRRKMGEEGLVRAKLFNIQNANNARLKAYEALF